MAERIPHADTEVRQAFQRIEARVSGGADPGHAHTGASLSGIDISDDTNLAVTAPIVLTGDTLSLNQAAVDHDALLNTHNLTTDIDHGSIGGLAGDDHAQYHNNARGDARYYTETELDAGQLDTLYFGEDEHLSSSAGAGDAGKPIVLDAAGHIDATMINDGDVDHGSISGTGDDDHTIYLLADGTRALTGNLAVDALITIDGRDISVDGTALDSCVAIQGMAGVDSGATPGYLGAAANDGVLRASTGISYADGGNFVTLTTNDGQIVHDNLSGAVANEHIDHTSVTFTAGSGMAGGGDISTNRSFDLDINSLSAAAIAAGDFVPFWDITATATNKKITFANFESTLNHDSLASYDANKHVDHTGVSISSGVGLSGGGTIASTRTLALDINGLDADTIVAADTIAFYDDTGSHCNKTTFANFKTALALEDEKVKVDSGATAGYLGVAAGDGVLRTNAAITWTDGGNFVTLSCNPGYVARGYTGSWDFEIGDFTIDSDYHELDLSSIVPAGAYAVYLRVQVKATAANVGIFYLENGTSVPNRNMIQTLTPAANVFMSSDGFVKLDANRKVKYWAYAATDTNCDLCVRGWMI